MSQEPSYAAAVREEATLSTFVPRLANATLCQHVGRHLPGESLWLWTMLYRAGCEAWAPFKSSSPTSLGPTYLTHSRSTELLEGLLRSSGNHLFSFKIS